MSEVNFISEGLGLGESKQGSKSKYSVLFKKRVVRDLLHSKQRIIDIANKYKVTPSAISSWKYLYGKSIKKDIDKKKVTEMTNEENSIISELKREYEKKIDLKNRELEELYSEIGRLTVKVKVLEKDCEHI